jgi:hypothetical protein
VVVAVGFTVVEPLADVEVKVPGAMEMLVAPVTDQLNVLLEPEVIVVGLAVNDTIAGSEPVPVDEPDGIVEPQPSRPMQASEVISRVRRSTARGTQAS